MAKHEEIVDAIRAELLSHIVSVTRQPKERSEAEILKSLPITYSELVGKAKLNLLPRGLGPYLTALGNDCARRGEPRLDYLVINKRTGMPGFNPSMDDWRSVISACSRHPWTGA